MIRKYWINLVVLMATSATSAMVDTNADGMSDVWQSLYNAESLEPSADADADGQSNLQESIAGTDPFSAISALSITSYQYFPLASVLHWNGISGVSYQIQKTDNLSGSWADIGVPKLGHDGLNWAVDSLSHGERSFYRVKLLGTIDVDRFPEETESIIGVYDTDGDGVDDFTEILNGTSPFNVMSTIPTLHCTRGKAMQLSWHSVVGKYYRVQCTDDPSGSWQDIPGEHIGTGGVITSAVSFPSGSFRFVRVLALDKDTDADGVTDWEEIRLGLNPELPLTDSDGMGDYAATVAMFAAEDVIQLIGAGPTANVTTMEDGKVKIMRDGGVDEITVHYSVAGSATAGVDYEALSGTVIVPFGKKCVEISITPIESSSIITSESVILTLNTSPQYTIGSQNSQQVNVLKEVAINVQDYGAIGDGVTDNVAAIQAAIHALENSTTHNTLYFPDGIYMLGSYEYTPHGMSTSNYRILKLGTKDLVNRDLIIRGAGSVTLYSTVSPTRAKMLLVMGNFRSLQFENIKWEKIDIPLQRRVNIEPNGATGVAIKSVDSRVIELVQFKQCEFINCHRSISFDLTDYIRNGLLRNTVIKDCVFLNPYGSNTIDSQAAYGGGQQIFISPWVGNACYEGNLFQGTSELMNEVNNPGGVIKDGSHFGSPLQLVFAGNIVKSMGVEGVYQTSYNNRLGNTLNSFLMPAPDGFSQSDVLLSFDPSFLSPGDYIGIVKGVGLNDVLRIVSVDILNNKISVVNEDFPGNSDVGVTIASGRPIYLQSPNPSEAIIEHNVMMNCANSIAVIAKANIRKNIIYNGLILVNKPFNSPVYPASRGAVVDHNIINTQSGGQYFSHGIYSWGPNSRVTNNDISVNLSKKFIGIRLAGADAYVRYNVISAQESVINGYSDVNKSVGIAFHASGEGAQIIDNTTQGFDIGVGPYINHAIIPHSVIRHTSINDQLGVDPRGVINP